MRYADLVVGRIVAAVERLRSFPESGRSVPERNAPGVREIVVRPYREVYRVGAGAVEIVTVGSPTCWTTRSTGPA